MALKAGSHPAEVLGLPLSLVSRVDAIRLARELEAISGTLEQEKLQHHKTAPRQLSKILEAMVTGNRIDIDRVEDRNRLTAFLKELKTEAPTIHMSFAAEPSSLFTAKLITWLRSEVHPLILLDIGLQPSIAAGCIIRTSSKYFDCSMRQHLVQNKPKLFDLMRGAQHA